MNGRAPTPPQGVRCGCGRYVAVLTDGTPEVHTPCGDPYAPACTRPVDTPPPARLPGEAR